MRPLINGGIKSSLSLNIISIFWFSLAFGGKINPFTKGEFEVSCSLKKSGEDFFLKEFSLDNNLLVNFEPKSSWDFSLMFYRILLIPSLMAGI